MGKMRLSYLATNKFIFPALRSQVCSDLFQGLFKVLHVPSTVAVTISTDGGDITPAACPVAEKVLYDLNSLIGSS